MDNFRSLIDAWPSREAFAEDNGVDVRLVAVWYHRNSVPADYWQPTIAGAKARKIKGVTLEKLLQLSLQRKRKAA